MSSSRFTRELSPLKRFLGVLFFPVIALSLSGCDLQSFEVSDTEKLISPVEVSPQCAASLTSERLPLVETAPGVYYMEVKNQWDKSLCEDDVLEDLELTKNSPDDDGNSNYSVNNLQSLFPQSGEGEKKPSFDRESLQETDSSKLLVIDGLILTVSVEGALEYEEYSFPPTEDSVTLLPDGTAQVTLDFSKYPSLSEGEVKVDVETRLLTLAPREN